MAESKPEVLLVQLGDGMQVEIFEDLYLNLRKKIEAHHEIVKKTTASTIIEHVSQLSSQLKAVLVIDGGLSKQKFKKVQVKLSQYVKAGGTAIMCCLFSSFVSGPNFIAMMQNMDLPWEYGDYHRTTFALNPAYKIVFGPQAFASLQNHIASRLCI